MKENLFEEKRRNSLEAYWNNKKSNSEEVETSLADKLSLALGTIKDVVTDLVVCGEVLANDDTRDARQNICDKCKNLEIIRNKCKVCGCYMDLKIPLRAARCPLGYW